MQKKPAKNENQQDLNDDDLNADLLDEDWMMDDLDDDPLLQEAANLLGVPVEKGQDEKPEKRPVVKKISVSKPIVEQKPISEEKRVGASRECQFKSKGFAKERITAIDEMKSLSMEMYESDFPLKFMRWTYYLSSKNGITSLKTITEYRVKYGLLGLLLNQLIMKSKFNKTMEEVFLSFKKYAESI